MMEPNPEEDQKGFELSGGPAPYTANIRSFEFQDGMWGKWIEVNFDDEKRTKFDVYDSPQNIYNLGILHKIDFNHGQQIIEMRFRTVKINNIPDMISGIEGLVLVVRDGQNQVTCHRCFNSEASQQKFETTCYKIELGESEAKMVGLQLLSQPS